MKVLDELTLTADAGEYNVPCPSDDYETGIMSDSGIG